MTSRYKIIAVQAEGADRPRYLIKDRITGKQAGPIFDSRDEAMFWASMYARVRMS